LEASLPLGAPTTGRHWRHRGASIITIIIHPSACIAPATGLVYGCGK